MVLIDPQRFELERLEVASLSSLAHFELLQKSSVPNGNWERYMWLGEAPTKHLITVSYPFFYPSRQPYIHAYPRLETHHQYDDEVKGLCLMYGHEWSPNYTAATIMMIAFRFLDDYEKGLTE